MGPDAAPPASYGGLACSRQRDAAVCALLDVHPVTAALLARTGLFTGRSKALLCLRRLARHRRVRLAGTVRRHAGAPEHVYCRWRPKADQLRHELDLTEVCLGLSAGRVLRGPRIVDRHTASDAEVWINGACYCLELDRGTMRLAQIERRFARYEGCPRFSLWVCADARRREALKSRAGRLRSTALFTTFAEAVADPHAAIWEDVSGARAALPRQR